ncbi:MAG: hypothetical protein ABSD85_12945 [Acidimicrobiales bacterium]
MLAAEAIIAVAASNFEFWVYNFDEVEALAPIDETLAALAGGFGLRARPDWS